MSDEDVIPQWLRERLLETGDPYQAQAFPRVKVRICQGCNGLFNKVFEIPARPVLERMYFSNEPTTLSSTDRLVAARWMLKVDLLYALLRHWRGEVVPPPGVDINLATREKLHARQLLSLARSGAIPDRTVVAAGVVDLTSTRATPFRAHPSPGKVTLSSVTIAFPLLYETTINDPFWRGLTAQRAADPRMCVLYPVALGEMQWPPTPSSTMEGALLRATWRHTNTKPLIDVRRYRPPIE